MNTSSLAGPERTQKASKVRKKWSNFRSKMFGLPLYPCNAVLSTPIKHGSYGLAYEMHKKRQNKREGKRERKEEKCGIRSQKNPPKNPKKHFHAHTFSHSDPCAMTFRECKKNWQCLIVKNNIPTLFSSALCLISCLCWIPEVNVQPYPHFGCIFQNPRLF